MDCPLYSFIIFFFHYFLQNAKSSRWRNGRGRVHSPPQPPARAVRQRRGNQREANPQPQEPPL
jgi:hypothetical protein